MTKKNIRPQQVAPVQRESVTANSSAGALAVQESRVGVVGLKYNVCGNGWCDPFAGDDAE